MERTGEPSAASRGKERSYAQRIEALAHANRIRTERAALKASIRKGVVQPSPLLLDPPECLETASLAEMLLAVPGIGKVKLRRILTAQRLAPGKKLGALSARQRRDLADVLRPPS